MYTTLFTAMAGPTLLMMLALHASSAPHETLIVPSREFPAIQDAIDAAGDGAA